MSELKYTIDDVGGITANKAVMWGATPGATVKKPTGANVRIAGITTETQATQNLKVGVDNGGTVRPVTVKAASPNIAVDDKLVVHGSSGAFKKATLTSTVTTSGGGTTNKNTFTSVLTGKLANLLRVRYVDPGADGALSIVRYGFDVIVTLAYGTGAITSTAGDITTQWALQSELTDLMTCANTGDGAGLVTAGAYKLTGADNIDEGYYITARAAATADDIDIAAHIPIL